MRVELFAEAADDRKPIQQAMKLVRPLNDTTGGYLYRAEVAATRPSSDYTPRLRPHHPRVPVPFETNLILWQQ